MKITYDAYTISNVNAYQHKKTAIVWLQSCHCIEESSNVSLLLDTFKADLFTDRS